MIKRNPGKRSLARGVTIIELMVVVIMIGILSAIAVPKFMTSQGLNALDGDFVRLSQGIELGRKAAARTGFRHYLAIDTTRKTWKLYRETGSNTTLTVGSDSLISADSLSNTSRFGFTFTAPSRITTTRYSKPDTLFTHTAPQAGGLAQGLPTESCRDAATAGQADWSVITFCQGSTSPMESGVLYISTKRSAKRLYAVLYNPTIALRIMRFAWNGTSWSLN